MADYFEKVIHLYSATHLYNEKAEININEYIPGRFTIQISDSSITMNESSLQELVSKSQAALQEANLRKENTNNGTEENATV